MDEFARATATLKPPPSNGRCVLCGYQAMPGSDYCRAHRWAAEYDPPQGFKSSGRVTTGGDTRMVLQARPGHPILSVFRVVFTASPLYTEGLSNA